MSRISPYTILNIFRSFRTLPFWIKLIWRLFKDRRVPFLIKLIPVAAFVYLISPLDFLPDLLIPVFGFADDLAILFFLQTRAKEPPINPTPKIVIFSKYISIFYASLPLGYDPRVFKKRQDFSISLIAFFTLVSLE